MIAKLLILTIPTFLTGNPFYYSHEPFMCGHKHFKVVVIGNKIKAGALKIFVIDYWVLILKNSQWIKRNKTKKAHFKGTLCPIYGNAPFSQ